MIQIGTYKADTNIIMAPMAGCSDLPFRLIMREFGCGLCFFEMISANALAHGHSKTLNILSTNNKDLPIAAQLLGSDPEIMLQAAKKLLELADISFLDINCACPTKKVTSKGFGAALLNDSDKLSKIIKKLSSNLSIPVTIKIRLGYGTKKIKDLVKLVQLAQKSNVSAIFVHGRTRAQGYSGITDYEAIRTIKQSVKIPVIGSGDILDPYLADKMFRQTGCDGILVARGAFGNPWIFKQIAGYLKKGKILKQPTISQKRKILIKHLNYINKYKKAELKTKIGHMRKVAMWYLKGLPNAAKIRNSVCRAKSLDELKNIAVNFLKQGI